MSRALKVALKGALFLCLILPAQAIEGDYRVEGYSPGQKELAYKGYVTVQKSGETYTLFWRFGQNTFIGTGILEGDYLATTFKKVGTNQAGMGLFKVEDKKLSGSWTPIGGKSLGREHWFYLGEPSKK